MTTTGARPRRRWLLAVVAGVLAAVAVPGGPVAAHASLDVSSPASGAVVSTAPEQLVLEFDEAVSLGLGGVELADAEGVVVDTGDAVVDATDATTVVVPDVPDLADGVYVVVWQVSSSDGHPARGAFTFQVGAVAGDVDSEDLIASALEGRDADAVVSWSLGVARFVAFAGVTVLFGALVVHVLSGDDRPRRRARRLWWTAWTAALVGSVGVFVLQGPYLSGGSVADAVDPALWSDVADTRLGTALLVRVVLLAAAAALVRRAGRPLVAWIVVGLGVAFTFSVSGHPSAVSPAAAGVVADLVHLVAVSAWLGGLAGVLVARPPADVGTRRFSTLATIAVPVIVVTGVWQTWHLIGIDDLADLTATTWGRTLLVKLSFVVVLVTLGAVSRWLLRHDGPAGVRRLVITELVVGGLVLGITAGLVATPPTPPPPSEVFATTLVQGNLIADVSVTPGRVGSNEVHVVFTPPGGSLQPVVSVEARLRSADLPAVPVVLAADGPNHYLGTVQVPTAGEWILDLEVEPQANATVLLSTPITIPG